MTCTENNNRKVTVVLSAGHPQNKTIPSPVNYRPKELSKAR